MYSMRQSNASCRGVCGTSTTLDSLGDDIQTSKHCSCDFVFPVFKDCCDDFYSECPEEVHRPGQLPQKRLSTSEMTCMQLSEELSVKVVADCPASTPGNVNMAGNDTGNPETTGLLTSQKATQSSSPDNSNEQSSAFFQTLLVTDVKENITYKNMDTYRCNNPSYSKGDDLHVKMWKKLYHNPHEIFTRNSSIRDLKHFLSNGTLRALRKRHDGVRSKCSAIYSPSTCLPTTGACMSLLFLSS